MALVFVESLDRVRDLGERILDAGRIEPVVCVTTRHNEARPLLDAEALAEAVGALPVHVLRTGELTWELNALLPERFEVFGGASRIWWPGLRPTDNPRDHPLFFCWEEYEGPEAAQRLLRELDHRGWPVDQQALLRRTGPPAAGRPSPEPVPAVAAGPLDGMAVHDVIVATVIEAHRGGTLVELAPGLRRLIINKRGKPAPVVRPGLRVSVEVISVNAAAGTVEVRWAGDPPTAGPIRVPIPRPGVASPLNLARRPGPVDLAAAATGIASTTATDIAAATPASQSQTASPAALDRAPSVIPQVPGQLTDEAQKTRHPQPARRPDSGDFDEAPDAGLSLAAQLAADEVGPQIEQAHADIAGLRAAAQRVTRELDAEIEAARARVAEFTRSQVGSIIDSLQAQLDEARGKARELQRQLTAAEDDKRGVITELRKRTEKLTETTKDLRREKDRRLHVESQLHGHGVYTDAETQFRHEVALACDRLGAGDGGAVGRARDYLLGPDFLDSLEGLQGMDRSQVVEKIAAMLTDALPSRGHALRTTEAGNSPVRVRPSDGAKAHRWYLQHKSSAARRLHYWQLADGRVELANVAVHDDIAIR